MKKNNLMDSIEEIENNDACVVELSIEEINELTIDQLLEYRYNNCVIKLTNSEANPFKVRWSNEGLDISKDRMNFIIDSIKALSLKINLEKSGHKYYKDSIKNILELGSEIDKKILTNILDLNLENLNKENNSLIDPNKVDFKDIFNLINKANKSANKLSTIGGRVDYIVEKLNITDITEYVFVILALDAVEDEG